MSTPFKMERGVKYRDAAKTSIIPVKNIDPNQELLKKPESTIRTYLQKAKKLLKQELNEGNAVGVNRGSVYQTREE